MKFGYARVSTKQQELHLQTDALEKAGCDEIFEEKITGTTKERPKLQALLTQLRKDDVVVIYKLDRLSRSLKDLISIVEQIQKKGANFHSLTDNIETSSPTGKLTFHLFAALAEFERSIISQRTKAGLEAARARGRKGGRPKGLSKKAERTAILAESYYKEGELSIIQICEELNISKRTLYKYLRHRGVQIGKR
ncbi:MAG: recombinase family protein [Bacteroidota bacterium]